MKPHNLNRFVQAQEVDYRIALNEIKNGRKESHWMWYIFPQLKGLGRSSTAVYYAIEDLVEAQAYLQHLVLAPRIIEISHALLNLDSKNAVNVFGDIDSEKLKSSMTLFSAVPGTDPVFEKVLVKFFNERRCNKSLGILGKE